MEKNGSFHIVDQFEEKDMVGVMEYLSEGDGIARGLVEKIYVEHGISSVVALVENNIRGKGIVELNKSYPITQKNHMTGENLSFYYDQIRMFGNYLRSKRNSVY